MADKKLSELTETTTGSDTMQLFVNDAGVSKRITRGNLISGAVSAATTTYSIKAGTQIGGAGLELDAGGAGSGTDTVKLMESGSATVTRTDADTITIGATNTTYVDATTSVAGLMSTGDKDKIDGVETSANNYTHPHHSGDVVSAADGAMTIQTDAVDIAMLSATGTASSTTFLRGDNSWVTPTDTDTVYTHPHHSGDVVSAADGATTIQTGAVDIAMLSATGTASGTTFLRGDNTWVVPTDTNTDTKWDGGTTGLTAATGRTSLGLGTAATSASTAFETADANIVKKNASTTFSADQTFAAITETKTIKSASFTPNLATDGTLYSCTGTMTITMPTAEAGKSFTVIHATATSITWAGSLLWNGGSAPTAGSGIDIYVFMSDGSNWFGMQAGTGYA
jgi:hypothetical protein